MDVQDLILADYAAANQGGKFTLVGAGFSRINTMKIPCVHPLMYVLVRLKVTILDKGKNQIEVRIVGERGTIFKMDYNLDVPSTHTGEEHLPMPIQINNLKFDYAGAYNIEVHINGEQKASHSLTIVEATQL